MNSDKSETMVTSQAAWFVTRLFSGEMTERDELELEGWLSALPEHRREYQAMLDAWSDTEELETIPGLLPLDSSAQILHERPIGPSGSVAKKESRLWQSLALAATVLVAALVGVSTYDGFNSRADIQQFVSAVGEQKSIELADGSVVTLNTNSRILVDMTETRRRVILDQGEAFFDVAGDPERPFTVEAGARSITVLGTRFNVDHASVDLSVAVVEGAVVVHRKEDDVFRPANPPWLNQDVTNDGRSVRIPRQDQYYLQAGALLSFKNDVPGLLTMSSADMDKRHSWRKGIVRFDGEPLFEVIQTFNRYTKKKLLIQDRSVMNIKISGVFHIDQLDLALEGLESTFKLRITRFSDRVIIVGQDDLL